MLTIKSLNDKICEYWKLLTLSEIEKDVPEFGRCDYDQF